VRVLLNRFGLKVPFNRTTFCHYDGLILFGMKQMSTANCKNQTKYG
jgi:hypothetical protein